MAGSRNKEHMTTPSHSQTNDHGRTTARVVLAFITVYLAWGGTFLGIRFAIESIPVFMMAGSRFFIAGIILMTTLRLAHSPGFHWGSLSEWRDAAIAGVLLLLGGNGLLTWAEQYVPSGVASLFFGMIPLWMVLFDWLHPGGKTPTLNTAFGLFIGLAGVWILRGTAGSPLHASELNWGYLALLVSGCSWGAGAIYSRHVHAKGSPLLPVSRQMVLGGIALMLAGYGRGELDHFSLGNVTTLSWIGYAYLLIFGSLIGFTAYVWLMKVSTPAHVGTISYVNPVVAVFLGWSLGHEPLTLRIAISAACIVASVMIVLRKPH